MEEEKSSKAQELCAFFPIAEIPFINYNLIFREKKLKCDEPRWSSFF